MLVSEAALAVLLLVGAGLLIRSLVRLIQVDGGYEPSKVLTAQLFLPAVQGEEVRSTALVNTLMARLQASPGVVAAGAANMAPFGNSTAISGFTLPAGGPGGEPTVARANTWMVTPGFGPALGLGQERSFPPGRRSHVRHAGAGGERGVRAPVSCGRQARGGPEVYGILASGDDETMTEIVGVVDNVLKDGPSRPPQPEIYLAAGSYGREAAAQVFLLVRTAGDPLPLAPNLRRLVREIEPRAALDEVDRLTHRLSAAVAQPRFAALVLAVFAALALILAAIGLYGVLSYGVSQRRREMGVRAALGATRARLLRLVLREGLVLTVAGLALGLGAALAVTRLMASLLFGVEPLDAVAFSVAPLAMLGVAIFACLEPARRAAEVDPAEALRSE